LSIWTAVWGVFGVRDPGEDGRFVWAKEKAWTLRKRRVATVSRQEGICLMVFTRSGH